MGDDYDSNDDRNGGGDDDDDDYFGRGVRARRRAASDLVVARRPQLCVNCGAFQKMYPYDFCSKACKSQAQAKLNGPSYPPPPLSNQLTGSGLILPTFTGATTGPSPPGGFPMSSSPSGFPRSSSPSGFPMSSSSSGFPMSSSPSGFTTPLASPYGVPPPPYTVTASGPPPRGRPCSLPGCAERGPTSTAKYCSPKCGKAAVTQGLAVACLLCRELPKIGDFHWCGPVCRQKAEGGAPMLIEVPTSDPKFTDIENQFKKSWNPARGIAPPIHKIFKCINTKAAEDRFQQYRQNVEAAGNFMSQGKTAGNENRRWHGTIRKCKIGDSSIQLTPCSSPACYVCCIIKTGFDIKYAAQGWYGTGLYCSSHSSTSNGYAKGPPPGSQYTALFLNRVIVGKEHIWGVVKKGKDVSARALKAPPDGCDSVASDAKHNEVIVYKNDAMVPSWLVLYG